MCSVVQVIMWGLPSLLPLLPSPPPPPLPRLPALDMAPTIAVLFDSVAPLVNTISVALLAPTARAAAARAFSTASAASEP